MKFNAYVNFFATIQRVKEAPLSKSFGYTSYFSQFTLHLSHSQYPLLQIVPTLGGGNSIFPLLQPHNQSILRIRDSS